MWWAYVIAALVVIGVVAAFVSVTRAQTRRLTRRTDRTASDLYDRFADSPAAQRRHARKRGGGRRDND